MASDGFKKLSKTMDKEETDDLLADLSETESDRGAALLGCATVEFALKYFMTKHMVDLSPSEDGSLFSNSGPLSDLGGRIAVSYAFGLIDDKMRHDLLLLKDIRNVFGHAPRRLSFERSEIAIRCGRFHCLAVHKVQPSTPRAQYVGAAKVLFIMLKHFGAGLHPGLPFGLPYMPGCKLAEKRSAPVTGEDMADQQIID